MKHQTTLLINIILLTSLIICLTNCSTTIEKSDVVNLNTASIKQTTESLPRVDVKVTLRDTVLKYGDKLWLNIILSNNRNEEQKLLFDKPRVSTGGPWGTTCKVTDIKTKMSVLEYENKAMLSSQIYTVDQLRTSIIT